MESSAKAIEEGIQTFDRKPMVKGWTPDVEMNKALTKITILIGKPLKTDSVTTNKERLMYARVLVEVTLDQDFPNSIMFENEKGQIIEQKVHYEWRPVLCSHCKFWAYP
ncbi:hypothetical protein P3S67_011377 [Capsicum chacoense]